MGFLGFIPARGGSKGIVGKNLRIVGGKPMIAWSIEAALRAETLDRVVVSTDSEEIAAVARAYGAETPFLRPASLATDEAPTDPSMIHAVENLERSGYRPEAVVLLQPTSPYRHPGRIDAAIRHYLAESADSLVSVTPQHAFLWTDPAAPRATYDPRRRPRRQDLPHDAQTFRENGSIYVTRTSLLLEIGSRLGGKIVLFEMSQHEGHEIDTLEDLAYVDFLLRNSARSDGTEPPEQFEAPLGDSAGTG